MSVAEALAELQAILGKGLHPAAIPKVREVLVKLKEGDVPDSQTSAPLGVNEGIAIYQLSLLPYREAVLYRKREEVRD
jgi:hypothetical protein